MEIILLVPVIRVYNGVESSGGAGECSRRVSSAWALDTACALWRAAGRRSCSHEGQPSAGLHSKHRVYRLISSLEPGFFLPLWRTKFSRAESRERKLAGFWCAFSPYQKCARVLRSSVMVSSFLLEEGIREKRRKLTGCGSRILRWLKINLGLEAVYNYSSFFFFFKWLNYLVISDCLSLWYFGCSAPGWGPRIQSHAVTFFSEPRPPAEGCLNVPLFIPVLPVKVEILFENSEYVRAAHLTSVYLWHLNNIQPTALLGKLELHIGYA